MEEEDGQKSPYDVTGVKAYRILYVIENQAGTFEKLFYGRGEKDVEREIAQLLTDPLKHMVKVTGTPLRGTGRTYSDLYNYPPDRET